MAAIDANRFCNTRGVARRSRATGWRGPTMDCRRFVAEESSAGGCQEG